MRVSFSAVNVNDIRQGSSYRINSRHHNKDFRGGIRTYTSVKEGPKGELQVKYKNPDGKEDSYEYVAEERNGTLHFLDPIDK